MVTSAPAFGPAPTTWRGEPILAASPEPEPLVTLRPRGDTPMRVTLIH